MPHSYSQEEARRYFELVENPTHWKDPIDAVVSEEDLDGVLYAITFFTGTIPNFEPFKYGNGRVSPNKFRVTSEGYRLGPCGDC